MVGRFLTGSGKRPAGGGEVAAPGGRRKVRQFRGKGANSKVGFGYWAVEQAKGRLFELAFFPLSWAFGKQDSDPTSHSLFKKPSLSIDSLYEPPFVLRDTFHYRHKTVTICTWEGASKSLAVALQFCVWSVDGSDYGTDRDTS